MQTRMSIARARDEKSLKKIALNPKGACRLRFLDFSSRHEVCEAPVNESCIT